MIKFLFVFMSFQAVTQARQIFCQQNPRDVALRVQWQNQKVTLKVQSPMGYDYLPQIEGPLGPSTMKWAAYQMEQLKGLQSEFTVSWPEKSCQWTLTEDSTKTRLECNGPAESSVTNLQFHTLTLSRLVESTLKEDWGTRRFRLGTSVDGAHGTDFFFVTIPVSESACLDFVK